MHDTGPRALATRSKTKSPNRQSEILHDTIDEFLARFSASYSHVVSKSKYAIWYEAFADLEPRVVATACREVERTFIPTAACPFPTPAHVRGFIQNAKALVTEHTGETAWHETLAAIAKQYHPDIGWRGPRLTERIDHAIRAANGVHYVSQCSEEDLIWAKKRFIECYQRDEVLPDAQHLIAAPVLKILREFVAPKALPPSEPYIPERQDSHRKDTAMTDAQWEARRDFLKKQCEEIKARQPAIDSVVEQVANGEIAIPKKADA